MDRYTRNKTKSTDKKSTNSLYKMQLETELLREELNSGVLFVNKLHRERVRLVEAMEREVEKQQELREKIDQLKAEYSRLQKSQKINQKLLSKTQTDRKELERTVEETKKVAQELVPNKSETIRNSFPKLIVLLNKGEHPTEKSILLTCLGGFIRTMSENEFEEYNWTAKVAENYQGVGARIRFDKIFMSEQDLKSIYRPVVDELAQRFSRSGLSVTAKTKKQNGIVTALDLIIKVPSKIREANLGLP